MKKDWLWQPSLIVFISNACVMTIELVAGRIIAPYVGVSLYTWTSVIGVILAGMSAGNFIGGKLADRFASRPFLGVIFILAGVASLSVLLTAITFGEQGLALFPNLPLVTRMVVYISSIFFIPSTVLGTISPLVVKLTMEDLSHSGSTIGKIYASIRAWQHPGHVCHRLLPDIMVWHAHHYVGRRHHSDRDGAAAGCHRAATHHHRSSQCFLAHRHRLYAHAKSAGWPVHA